MNNNAKSFDNLTVRYRRMRKRLPNKIAIVAVNFFKRNFKVGGFVDKPFKKWKDGGKKGGKTLVQTGNLRRSIKKLSVRPNRITVGVAGNIPYAQIHNEGGKIPITAKMRRYFWAMFKKTGDAKYKAMALTPKQFIEIPERRFIGDSKALDVTLQRLIIREIKTLQL